MPKSLMSDIRTGSVDVENQIIDLDDLDNAYTNDQQQAAAPGMAMDQNDQI
jgi:hypothetical protein